MRQQDQHKPCHFPQYDAMSTEELYAFLETGAEQLELDETQWAELSYAAELYARRTQETMPLPHTAEVSLAEFRKSYPGLLPSEPTARNSGSVLRKAAIITAVAAFSFTLITATISAAGVPLWSAIIEKTKDNFRFEWQVEGNQEIVPGDASLIMEKYGVTDGGIPNWVPSGYTFDYYSEPSLVGTMSVSYQREDGYLIRFKVSPYNPDVVSFYEKSDNAKIYKVNGVQYYIFPNLRKWTAVWMEDGCECSLAGPFTQKQLKKVLNEMNKG